MTAKQFISANELLTDAYRLAAAVYDSGYRPTFIVGVWRGGAPVGIAVQEFLAALGFPSNHIAIRTSAYTASIDEPLKGVEVHNLGYLIEQVQADDRLLVIDDVFDSGRSLLAVLEELTTRLERTPETIKTACPWYKPSRNTTELKPDFYLYETDSWLVFPHEMVGLSDTELERKDPFLAELLEQRRETSSS